MGFQFLLLIALIVGLLVGCEEGVKTYSEPEQGIEVGVADEFILALGSNPGAGYIWETDYDQDMLQLVKCGYQRVETDKRVESGASGVETFHFKALNKGRAEITMTYRQLALVGEPCTGCDDGSVCPWVGEGIQWVFKVQIKP